ncbi:GerAB/ArcD/ProY family transporter [Haloimpatiens sp. FM7315]|uniref:GerAB/ArcD/ProY family transporter n=1 Tax=Haloimpatiens sp. FM7315 TaxID=3298609 RepID=UPI003977785B
MEGLKNKSIVFVIFGAVLGYGVLELPKLVAEDAGTSGWIRLIMVTLFAVIIAVITVKLSYIHENKTLFEYSKELVGNVFGNVIIITYIIYFFLLFTFIIRGSAETIKLSVLEKTPVWAMTCMLFIAVYYAVVKGFKCISIISQIYGVIVLSVIVTVHILMFAKGEILNIKPLFSLEHVYDYFKIDFKLVLAFLGSECISFVCLDRKRNKNLCKYVATMVLIIGFLYILIVESCISIIGINDIVHYKDAVIATIRRVEIPYLEFFRRFDGLSLIVWIMSVFCTISIYAYGTVFFLSKYFKKTNIKILTAIVIVLGFCVSEIPGTLKGVQDGIKYIGYFGIIPYAVVPTSLLIITKVKKYDKKN